MNLLMILKEMTLRTCKNLINNLMIFAATADYPSFTKVAVVNGNNVIIFTNEGKLFVPRCVPITTIFVHKTSEKCLNDFKHTFTFTFR